MEPWRNINRTGKGKNGFKGEETVRFRPLALTRYTDEGNRSAAPQTSDESGFQNFKYLSLSIASRVTRQGKCTHLLACAGARRAASESHTIESVCWAESARDLRAGVRGSSA
jgi:hypothetical protein